MVAQLSRLWWMPVVAALALTGCENPQKKKEEEAAKNTFACHMNGERLVLRFADGEARMLMPNAQRITLYQIPTASGVRYSNGTLELRGKGVELQLIVDGSTIALKDCEPYAVLPPPAK
ncbi:MAG: MliC family protein [Betaproteobacteria bacterium]